MAPYRNSALLVSIALLMAVPAIAEAAPTETTQPDEPATTDPVRLRQRVTPLIAMLQESAAAGKDVVWGV